jgi:hypothetical protein
VLGYGGKEAAAHLVDEVLVENDEGWGFLTGPEFGCVHFANEPLGKEADLITYWLWRGDVILTSVRAAKGLAREEVVRLALEAHEKVPTCYPTSPGTFALYLRRATIKTYPYGY